jgi:hypothetical protein
MEVVADVNRETVTIRGTLFRFTGYITRFEKEEGGRMCTRCKKESF